MKRITHLLTALTFLAHITAAEAGGGAKEEASLQKLVRKLEQKYKAHGLDAIHNDLKHLWAESIRAGQKHSSSETNSMQKFLWKLEEDYNKAIAEKAYNGLEDEWDNYMKAFGKEYSPKEMAMRKAIFKENKERSERHNELFKLGKVSYDTELNYLSDWTPQELQKMKGLLAPNTTRHAHPRKLPRRSLSVVPLPYDPLAKMPHSIDWRDRDAVTSVMYQGSCSACYAIAPVGALEAFNKKRTGNLVRLSVQNILDCTWNFGNSGCNGGFMYPAFEYAQTHGIIPEYWYPYRMNDSHRCRWMGEYAVHTIKGYLTIRGGDEVGLMHAVATYGPVAVSITSKSIRNYRSGVFYTAQSGPVDHTGLVVGYGTDPKEGDYWIFKNSWGTSWGDKGYMLIARNRKNVCGVASCAYLPI